VRRTALAIASLTLLAGPPLGAADPSLAGLAATLTSIARAQPGQIGVSLVHVESGARLFSFNGGRPFPMASVYKLPIAVELLTQIAEGRLTFDRRVAIGPSDIRDCCTLSRRYPDGGVTLSARELLELMITESDNTAGDAVLRLVGGPPAVERRLAALGFGGIHVNRYEGAIAFEMDGVTNPPPEAQWTLGAERRLVGDVPRSRRREARARYTTDARDSATPDDMAAFLARLERGDLLPRPMTALLLDLMAQVKTGPHRLKYLLPPDTIVAHKTGTTDVVTNDAGLITLPDNGGHLALAVFITNGGRAPVMQRTIAALAAAAYEAWTGTRLPPERQRSGPKSAAPRLNRAPRGPVARAAASPE
jgi:beta-lactamase class A